MATAGLIYINGATSIGVDRALRAKAKTEHYNDTDYGEYYGLYEVVGGAYQLAANCYTVSAGTYIQYNTAVASATSLGITADTWQIYDIFRNSSTDVQYLVDGINLVTVATQVATGDEPAFFAAHSSSATTYCDWVLLRQQLATEPTWGIWSGEEQQLIISDGIKVGEAYSILVTLLISDGIKISDSRITNGYKIIEEIIKISDLEGRALTLSRGDGIKVGDSQISANVIRATACVQDVWTVSSRSYDLATWIGDLWAEVDKLTEAWTKKSSGSDGFTKKSTTTDNWTKKSRGSDPWTTT